ncbi:TAXI family TRAP transporter solute-binding subunit [Pararhizobium haloflavum]|uniref:TAXI family TRAP transporter solute-binding subunit n=1 Tax=Pararhizobium haloflavum TaxID=2037914 RepID=UPI0012FFE964|nr:TAXI family TRAP transporter solute-binding subunit [Pararhizobium haloflavum]
MRTVIAAGALALATQGAVAQDFSLMSAPFGSGSYVLGGALEQIVAANSETIRVSHSESPGFAFNHIQLQREPDLRKTMIIGSGRAISQLAVRGEPPFEEELPPVKALANYNLGSNFLATLDPEIKTVADLEGRQVALGRPPQINWTIQPEWLLKEGWGLGDSVSIQYLGTQEAVTALLDGQVDAAIVGGYFDPLSQQMELSPQTSEFLASGREAHFLDWGTAEVEKTAEAGMPMTPITLPAEALPGRDEPLEGFADTISWTVSEEFPEEAAYEITKLIIEHVGEFAEYHALGKLMSPEALVYGWDREEFHPGALRAYQEAGILE